MAAARNQGVIQRIPAALGMPARPQQGRARPQQNLRAYINLQTELVQNQGVLNQAAIVSQNLEEGATSTVPVDRGNIGAFARSRDPAAQEMDVIVAGREAPLNVLMAAAELSYYRIIHGDESDIMGGAFGLISIMFPRILLDPQMEAALEGSGWRVAMGECTAIENIFNLVSCNIPGDLEHLYNRYGCTADTELSAHATVLIPDLRGDCDTLGKIRGAQYHYAAAGIILAMMGKIVHEQNAGPWYDRRWKAFCGALGVTHSVEIIYTATALPMEAMVVIGRFFSSAQAVRRRLMEVILMHNRSEDNIGIACQTVSKYLKWTEMSHIGLINKYIFRLHPHLLFMRELEPFLNDYMKAMSKLAGSTPDNTRWCYAKILERKVDMDYLQRNKFLLLTSIAQEIGQSHSETLAAYQGTYGNLTGELGALKTRAVRLAWSTAALPPPGFLEPNHITELLAALTQNQEEQQGEEPIEQD